MKSIRKTLRSRKQALACINLFDPGYAKTGYACRVKEIRIRKDHATRRIWVNRTCVDCRWFNDSKLEDFSIFTVHKPDKLSMS